MSQTSQKKQFKKKEGNLYMTFIKLLTLCYACNKLPDGVNEIVGATLPLCPVPS